jgi:transcriptional regulator with GAF, ATPase, and Fis domain
MERQLILLQRMRDVVHALAGHTRIERLIPKVLDGAIEITRAERGFLVRKRGGRIEVEVARGFDKQRLRSRTGDVSRTVVERVLNTERGLVTTREEDADVLEVSSVRARRVRSILCVPLRLRGELRGALYLDHRFLADTFVDEDIEVLETFASMAALVLESAEQAGVAADATPGAPAPEYPVAFGELVGQSEAARRLFARIEEVARGREPALIVGEAGSGKTAVAREIHARGSHPGQPFEVRTCAAVSAERAEAELFGEGQRPGLLARAHDGTLLLTDLDHLPPPSQARLAEVLRARTLRCQLLCTTTLDLRPLVEAGAFRGDLYYRLDAQRVAVPPLRQRREDLELLLNHLAERVAGSRLQIAPPALACLSAYRWPGNVLELEGEVRRLLEVEGEVRCEHLSPSVAAARPEHAGPLPTQERSMVAQALREAEGNKSAAARSLGIPRTTLYRLIKRYDLG